jgi:subtilisin family serine protease
MLMIERTVSRAVAGTASAEPSAPRRGRGYGASALAAAACAVLLGACAVGSDSPTSRSASSPSPGPAAAAAAGSAPPPSAAADPVQLNVAMGRDGRHDERDLILVTIEQAVHGDLVREPGPAGSLPLRYQRLIDDWQQRIGVTRIADWPLASLGVRCLVFAVDGAGRRDEVIARLQREQTVETVQPLQRFETLAEGPQATAGYNDPYRSTQHGLDEMEIGPSHRWARGQGVRVAIVDTGVDSTHPEFEKRVTLKRNFVDGKLDDFDRDVHGTAVAAVIGAAANNATGIVGVAPSAELMALKACWQDRPGSDAAVCNSFTLAKALNLAIEQHADIINLSLGGPADPLLGRLLRRAIESNIVVVGAIDPQRANGFAVGTPGVVGVDKAERPTRTISSGSLLLAPGERIISARPNRAYDLFSGSSLSTAMVSGLAALVRERKPQLPVEQVAAMLAGAVNPRTGSVSACRALAPLAGEPLSVCAAPVD